MEFVRGMGPVLPRAGSSEIWPGENAFCNADSVIRFPLAASGESILVSNATHPLRCVFRRLSTDGEALKQLHVGFRAVRFGPRTYHDIDKITSLLLPQCAQLPVEIPNARGGASRKTMMTAGKAVAALLLARTTSHSTQDPESWWLTPGRPIWMVEFQQHEVPSMPRGTKPVYELESNGRPIRVRHYSYRSQNGKATVWLIQYSEGVDKDIVRRLRIHLSRLHAERECMQHILQHLSHSRIGVQRGSDESEELQRYLAHVAEVFFAERRYGFDLSPVLRTAYGLDDIISAGDRPGLEQELNKMRAWVSRRTRELLDTNGGTVMNINIGDNNTFEDSPVGIGMSIQNSLNRINGSVAADELKGQLTELTETVRKLCEELPPEEAGVAAHAIQDFTKEATSASPNPKKLAGVGAKLSKLAAAVSIYAAPVATLIVSIIAIV